MIHILRHSFPLCSFTVVVPADWPIGHKWVHFPDVENEATCPGCKARLASVLATVSPRDVAGRAVSFALYDSDTDPEMREPEPIVRKLPLELTPMTEDEVRELLTVCLVGEIPWPTVQRMLATLAAWLPDRPK